MTPATPLLLLSVALVGSTTAAPPVSPRPSLLVVPSLSAVADEAPRMGYVWKTKDTQAKNATSTIGPSKRLPAFRDLVVEAALHRMFNRYVLNQVEGPL